ncbi:antifreeze protein [Phyllobacterium endophyticum]|nr:antifreeze protein [Phyllobacterium endophyticum]MBB3233571.1 flagellar capping protein FliD [Phyllobacterium endophyticum]TXR46527.1 antifreeze protein [Phyllobacterium endophyticum]TYR41209.1 antifreeze protein [Phyllobacterium endophyticum]
MNQFRFNLFAATVVAGASLAFLTLPASAQSVTKTCSTQYQAAKEAGTLKGQKWPDFLSACSAKLKDDDDAEAAAPAAKTPAKKAAKETAAKPAKAQTTAAASSGGMSAKAVTKACSTQYQAAKEAGTLNGQKWPQFLSSCSDSLKSDDSDATVPDEPAPTKASTSKMTKTQVAKATTSSDGKALSPAQVAFRARISECGDQWQQAKAGNKTRGMTWPQYWSACNTRLKSE